MTDTARLLENFEALPTLEVAAVQIGCSRALIDTLVRRGELQVIRFSRRCVRVDPASLQAYLQKRQPQSA